MGKINNYRINLWTEEEIALFDNEKLTDRQISEITGRTLGAVRKKRYVVSHPYGGGYGADEFERYEKVAKEERILRLAKQ